MYCKNCGKEIHDEAVVCVGCGTEVYPQKNPHIIDEPSTGLNILSFLIPFLGLILYLVWNNATPQKAKSIGKWALAGFVIGIIGTIIWVTSVNVCAYCGDFGFSYKEEGGLYYCQEHYVDALRREVNDLLNQMQ